MCWSNDLDVSRVVLHPRASAGGAEGSRAPPFLVVEWKLLQVCYAFWPYRFPEAYGPTAPPAALVAKFGGVIDRYLEFLDRELGSLLAAYRRR